MIAEVQALAADERGAALGFLLAGADLAAVSRLAGGPGARCRAALEALAGSPDAPRASAREALVAWLATPVPEGLTAVHPGWIRRALESESSAVVRAVATGLPAEATQVADEVLRARGEELEVRGQLTEAPGVVAARRAVFAALAPMPIASGPPVARALCALSSAALLDEIDRRGAETLGHALAGAPDAVVARAAAGVGAAGAPIVLAAAKAGVSSEARAAARALVAAASTDGTGAARAVGLRAVARQVGDEGFAALVAVAQRLPPSVGDALLVDPGGEVSVVGRVVKGHGHVVPAIVMDARAQAAEIAAAAVAERERARAEGFARGRDEGRAHAAAALVGLLAAARAEADAALARVAPAAFAIATRMAEKIVGRAVALDPTIMATIAAEAVAACRTRGGVAQLRVHPDDLAPVFEARATLAAALGGEDALEIVADESVGRHGCVVDTAVGRVDARLATQLEALARVLSSPDTAEGGLCP